MRCLGVRIVVSAKISGVISTVSAKISLCAMLSLAMRLVATLSLATSGVAARLSATAIAVESCKTDKESLSIFSAAIFADAFSES